MIGGWTSLLAGLILLIWFFCSAYSTYAGNKKNQTAVLRTRNYDGVFPRRTYKDGDTLLLTPVPRKYLEMPVRPTAPPSKVEPSPCDDCPEETPQAKTQEVPRSKKPAPATSSVSAPAASDGDRLVTGPTKTRVISLGGGRYRLESRDYRIVRDLSAPGDWLKFAKRIFSSRTYVRRQSFAVEYRFVGDRSNESEIGKGMASVLNRFVEIEKRPLSDNSDFVNPGSQKQADHFKKLFDTFLEKESRQAGGWQAWLTSHAVSVESVTFSAPKDQWEPKKT